MAARPNAVSGHDPRPVHHPLTQFLRLVDGIMLRGAFVAALWPDALALAAFSVIVMGAAIARFHKRLD